jgi:uncharacterized membrane protein
MDATVVARALHVLFVVIWIGGVALVTTVALPAVRRGDLGADRLAAFEAIERRFVWQARAAIVMVGLTGFHMAAALDLWSRFALAAFWWMHAMVGLWLLFALLLFVIEPLVVHRRLHAWAAAEPARAFAWLQRAHWVLLALSLVTVAGAVAGSHGGALF